MKPLKSLLTIVLLITANTALAQDDIAAIIATDSLALIQQKIGDGKFPLNGQDGQRPLLLAVRSNAQKTAAWLLAQGADKEVRTAGGSTPLSLAAYFGNLDLVNLFIQAGSELGAKSNNGYQPLDWALGGKNNAVVEALFFAWGMKHAADSVETDLLQAIRSNRPATAKSQPNFTSFPLVLAIMKNDSARVAALLSGGFNPNQQNAAGYAPLPTAARLGNPGIVQLLLKHGADPNFGGSKGNDVAGALNQAARGLSTEAAKVLITGGADVNRGNAKGYTPLMICAWNDTEDGQFTELLLTKGAAVHQKADDGYEAFDAAMEGRNRLFTQLVMKALFLQSAGNAAQTKLFTEILTASKFDPKTLSPESAVLLLNYAILKGDSLLFMNMLDNRVNPNLKNASGHYPLTLAASWGEKNMLAQLIGHKAQLDLQNENRYHTSALIEGARDGDVEIAKILLERGAQVNLPDAHNDHALNWAVYFGHAPLVQLLLAHGADHTQIGRQTQDNALDIARRMSFPEVIAILEKAGAKATK